VVLKNYLENSRRRITNSAAKSFQKLESKFMLRILIAVHNMFEIFNGYCYAEAIGRWGRGAPVNF